MMANCIPYSYLSDAGGLPDEEEVEVAEVVLYAGPRHIWHTGHVDPKVSLQHVTA